MIKVGQYNTLKVIREVEFGVYLDDGDKGILLPKRFVPKGTKIDDVLTVFVYHDSDGRPVATTQKPFGTVGEFVLLEAVSVTPQGAFMNWGLMKDIFVPKSKQLMGMRPGGRYLVYIYIDEQTGRVAATEKFDAFLSNDTLTVKELDAVHLTTWRRTGLGYVMIINHQHTGVLHFSDIYKNISEGFSFEGYVKKVFDDNRIDVMLGKPGYQRVEGETDKVLRLLKENDGYLPYNDKSSPEDIYSFFGMSKKTFKMTTGSLYKQRKITFTQTGIKSLEE